MACKKDVRMLLILKDTVKGLGVIGDIVKVRPGYARNFLLSKANKAIRATKENVLAFEKQKGDIGHKREEELSLARAKFEQIQALGSIAITHNASQDGKLFGSVTNRDIVGVLKDHGVDVSFRDVLVKGNIRHIGEYSVSVYLHPNVTASLVLRVEKR